MTSPTYFLKPSVGQKLASFLEPVLLLECPGEYHELLQIYLYRNQLQLATGQALYSDGLRYMPFRIAYEAVGEWRLVTRKSCLILGCGLGSNIQILQNRYGCQAHYTLVEQEPKVLSWCQALLRTKGITSTSSYLGDAAAILPGLPKAGYDLICVDVFIDQIVPQKITATGFLSAMKDRLMPAGVWIVNYMELCPERDESLRRHIEAVFPTYHMVKQKRNIIYWGTTG